MIVTRFRRPSLPSSAAMASAFNVLHGAGSSNHNPNPYPSSSYASAARGGKNSSSSHAVNGGGGGGAQPSTEQYTITALSRWSVLNKQLPPVDKIRALHVYDFDNTRMINTHRPVQLQRSLVSG